MATFTYDALDRLKTESGPVRTQALSYDGNGNRTADGVGTLTYLPNSNLLQTAHGQSISKDAVGNTTNDGIYTYLYNQAGQLAQVKQGVVVIADYFYDYQGRRTRKLVGTTTTVYHYDQENHLVAETNGLGTLLRTYVWRDDTLVIQIESSTGQDKPYYLEVDILNTPRTARDATGTIVWQWYADAFGNTTTLEDPDGDGTVTRINLRFPGQYYDIETGLHYNMARYYNPSTGRYLQPDPIGLAGGINTYSYVGGNPVNATDSSGLWANFAARVVFQGASRFGFPNAARMAAEAMDGGVIGCILTGYCSVADDGSSTDESSNEAGGMCPVPEAGDVINVTKDGVAIPSDPKYKIPDNYIENPNRSGSYGEIGNGKFKERLRIDPPTPPGTKGPDYSHYHKNGKGTHYSPRPGDSDPGF